MLLLLNLLNLLLVLLLEITDMSYTNQTVFDAALMHLRIQGVASVSYPIAESLSSRRCLYRDPEGNACAVGCLIPASLYDPKMEGIRAGKLGLSQLFAGVPPELLNSLQDAHDMKMPEVKDGDMSEWEKHMAGIADYWRLRYTPPGVCDPTAINVEVAALLEKVKADRNKIAACV